MKRISVMLTDRQNACIELFAERYGVQFSEMLRRLLDVVIDSGTEQQHQATRDWAASRKQKPDDRT